ncbi:TetR family transcriptional regulator [Kitasatospora saccharophila]|uniref:TetR family transcriptional regulator n=1 Tax=Kitasatospora saccharophila TaxID=407973 RepID=UPI0031E1737A
MPLDDLVECAELGAAADRDRSQDRAGGEEPPEAKSRRASIGGAVSERKPTIAMCPPRATVAVRAGAEVVAPADGGPLPRHHHLVGDDFRGCRYLALADPEHPGHAVTREYREHVAALFAAELARLGHPRPAAAGDQLLLLVDGVLAAGATRPGTSPAAAARELAEQVVGQAPGAR